jgi:hypothetical protein
LLFWLLTVTTTGPVVAEFGTLATMLAFDQLVTVAAEPLNRTTLLPWVLPKFVPEIVTEEPSAPVDGERPEIFGAPRTVNVTPALGPPAAVTTTGAVPLNVIVPVPRGEPKFDPVIVTEVFTGPEVGERVEIDGGGMTVNAKPLLSTPLAWTTTLPVVAPDGTGVTMVVAFQLVGLAATPLNLSVPDPCVAPKFAPEIVTDVPCAAVPGEIPVTLGGGTTVNETPLLASPPTVITTLPLVAPDGTVATMDVSLQVLA